MNTLAVFIICTLMPILGNASGKQCSSLFNEHSQMHSDSILPNLMRAETTFKNKTDLADYISSQFPQPEWGEHPLDHKIPKEITLEEKTAVAKYVAQAHAPINKYLKRKQLNQTSSLDLSDMKVVEQHLAPLESGLSKLPSYEGIVFRGFRMSSDGISPNALGTLKLFEKDSIIKEPAFVSSSRWPHQVTQIYAHDNPVHGNLQIILIIHSLHGRFLPDTISKIGVEAEVVFLPNTKFLVGEHYKSKSGYYVIELFEHL